jgi:hypothetical protein
MSGGLKSLLWRSDATSSQHNGQAEQIQTFRGPACRTTFQPVEKVN